jgi:hypothetical protein
MRYDHTVRAGLQATFPLRLCTRPVGETYDDRPERDRRSLFRARNPVETAIEASL